MATPNKKASSTVKNIIGQRLWKKLSNVGWKISVGALQRPMSSIELWFQYLNNICMISIRKCSIRVIRWCFFFKPRSVIFPGRRRLAFFPISIGESCMCFCRGWLMFSLPSKWKHAGVGRNTTSAELKRENLADLYCKFLQQHRTKKHPLPSKKILPASVCKKNCAMSAEKYQSRLFDDWCFV